MSEPGGGVKRRFASVFIDAVLCTMNLGEFEGKLSINSQTLIYNVTAFQFDHS